MEFRLSWHRFVILVLVIGLVVGTGLLWGLRFPYVGEAHKYHTDKPNLPLSTKLAYRQHIVLERAEVTGITLSLEPSFPKEGGIIVTLKTSNEKKTSGTAKFSDATVLGDLYVPLTPFRANRLDADLTIAITGTTKQVKLRYEIDSEKYKEGRLKRLYLQRNEEKEIQGTVAFTMHYRQRASDAMHVSFLMWIFGVLAVLALQVWWWRRSVVEKSVPVLAWSRNDWISLLCICILIGGFYGIFWLGTWGNILLAGDMPKDILYVESARQALLNYKIPYWHHFTCGGQPLLGNIESNLGSIMVPLALAIGSSAAFKVTLWLEVVIAGVGFYIVARLLGQRPVGALLPGLLIPLGSFISNRILLGHTMFIGGVAFAPWAIIGFLLARRDPRWGVLTSIALTLMIGRGDTHVLLYVLILLGLWAVLWAYKNRTVKPVGLWVS